jgi:hypothetical protein
MKKNIEYIILLLKDGQGTDGCPLSIIFQHFLVLSLPNYQSQLSHCLLVINLYIYLKNTNTKIESKHVQLTGPMIVNLHIVVARD